MRSFLSDVTLALRSIRRVPLLSCIAAVTIGLGVGANTAVFSVIRSVLLRPLPYRNPDRIVMVWKVPRNGTPPLQGLVTPAHFEAWRARNNTFDDLALLQLWQHDSGSVFDLAGPSGTQRLRGSFVSPNFFQLLGVSSELGRVFSPRDENDVAILSHGLWQRAFGGDLDVVGKRLELVTGRGADRRTRQLTVVGVLAKDFRFTYPLETELWIPLTAKDVAAVPRLALQFAAVGRLAGEVTMAQAQANARTMADVIAKDDPVLHGRSTIRLESVRDYSVGASQTTLLLLIGVSGFVVLIASLNVANLLLAHASERRRDLCLRMALGASRVRLFRQVLTESLVWSAIGGAVGVLVAVWTLATWRQWIPDSVPRGDELRVDVIVIAWAFGAVLLAALVGGIGPGIYATRQVIASTLGETSRTVAGSVGASRWRDMTTICQLSLVMALLIAATLLARTVWNLQRVELGFDTRGVVAIELRQLDRRYRQPEVARTFRADILSRARALSGVSDASGTSSVMFRSMGQRIGVALTNGDRVSAIRYGVVPNYFGTLSIPIVMGRPLLASDSPNGPAVAVISESLAQAAFHGESPLGKQLPLGIFGDPIEIVGVVGDVRHARLEEPPTPSFYIPIDQDSFSQTFWLLMRTSRTASSMAQSVRQIVQAADPAQPIETITSLQQVVEESFATRRFAAYTALAFSALAVLLAMAGMYGVVAQGVAERKNEIGVRLTLGATQRSIVGLILRSNARPVAVGVLLGILIALSCSRFFRGFLFGVPAADPVTISGTAVLLMLVCLAASCFPAIRAAREDPSHALRH